MYMDTLALLRKSGAILEGHFVGTSGRHLSSYINKDALLPDTRLLSQLCRDIAEKHADYGIDVVVTPAVAGISLSQWTAHHLSEFTGKNVFALFTEKTKEGEQILKRRDFQKLIRGKRVLIVDDTTTIGSSVQKVKYAVEAAGGLVIAIAVIFNRDPHRVNSHTMGVPFSSLAVIPMESYAPEEVPDWLARIPIDMQIGHGNKMAGHAS